MAIDYDVIVIGAGAAGMMCAIEAGRRGRRVLVLERGKKPCEKVRISGGGKCNFTNIHARPEAYLSQNPHFVKSPLARFTAADFIHRVEKHGIAYHEKTLGQLFCNTSSQAIIDMLLKDAAEAGADLRTQVEVTRVEKAGDGFRIHTSAGEFGAKSCVIATGGPSIPKMGATDWGCCVAKQFGLNIIPMRAGLVPFTMNEAWLQDYAPLSGVALPDVEVICGKQRFREAMLFTHRGLSGPAMLQISSYWQEGDEVVVNLLPRLSVKDVLDGARRDSPRQEWYTPFSPHLPKRFLERVVAEIGSGKVAELSRARQQAIEARLGAWALRPLGTEGYRTAEVALGGVDTKELSSRTMESAKVKGLYFIGETVDVTGHLGGYNFQWAWASGFVAGQVV